MGDTMEVKIGRTYSRSLRLSLCAALASLLACAGLAAQNSPRQSAARQTPASPAAPARSDSNGFLGSDPCAKCHAAIYESYQHTAMANASGPASDGVIAGEFDHKPSGVHYRVYTANGHVWLGFDRPGDAALQGKRELLYFIGSGVRGRSYLFEDQGFLFESPINWYGQRGVWDMAPAYQQSSEMPLNLPAVSSCLACHTSGMNPPAAGTVNKYPPPVFEHNGVTCERCHGEGKPHAANAGTILNPAKLSPERRDEVCMQCHLEGNVAIEQPNRHLYEFQPGQDLADYIRYFVFTGEDSRGMGALSQFQALAQSVCKKKAGNSMWCGSCHDPHSTPAPAQKVDYYRAKCLACHGDAFAAKHHAEQRDCVGCHMARAPSSDVAHTQVTDHRILRIPEMPLETVGATHVRDLAPFPPGPADPRALALAWESVASTGSEADREKARTLLEAAVAQSPKDAVLLAALGYSEHRAGAVDRAREFYERALAIDPTIADAASNLGVIEAKADNLSGAVELWKHAFDEQPGNSRIGMNIVFAYCAAGKFDEARMYIGRLLEFNPDLSAAKKLNAHLTADPPGCSAR